MIYTNTSHVDVGALRSFTLDLAFGADEQSFELACSGPSFTGGELVYIDGTEYGGIIDQYTQSTNSDATVYTGRTWHGMLAGKVLVPAAGSDYYTLSGDANACIAAVLTKVGLASVLTARTTAAGFNVNYQFNRFCNAYEGLLKMCASVGAVLMIQRHDGITELWAEQAAAIEDEADSDLMEFDVTRAHRVVNHLVCAGEGELRDREVIDLYADASGNISTTQTLTGVDEVALLYDYSGADSAELASSGAQKLKEYQTNGGATVSAVGRGDWHVGNRLQVRDNRSGTTVTAVIAKKIVKVERGVLTVDYEVGDHIAAEAANFDANLTGIAEQPKAFTITRANMNALINTLAVGTGTAFDDGAYIITENINGTEDVYYRRAISSLWTWLQTKTVTETTVANVISQTQTQEDNYPVTAANYYQWGKLAMLRITFKPAAAVSVGTNMSICTVNAGKLPPDQAYGGSGYIMGALTAAGALSGRPRTALTANTSYAMSFTYILA